MTIFLRAGTESVPDHVEMECPTLALLLIRIGDRSPMMQGEPLEVDCDTFHRAEEEMAKIRKARGYSGLPRACIAAHNFLLFGIPIVSGNG